MTLPTHIHMARDAYYKWREQMDREGIRFFRHKDWQRFKARAVPLELLSSSWTGTSGMVNCRYVLERPKGWSQETTVPFHKLEPLNDMEVIALCAAFATHA